MKIKPYLSFLTLCAIFSEGIGTSFNTSSLQENTDKSSNVHIRNKRIIDRSVERTIPAHLRDFPYVVSLHKNGLFACTGTILAAHVIISAAHCFIDRSAYYTIRSGSDNANSGSVHNIVSRVTHPNQTHGILLHDIVLMTIMPPIDLVYSPNRAIKIFEGNVDNRYMAFAVGFGESMQNRVSVHTGDLIYVVSTIMDQHDCKIICSASDNLANLRICTTDRYGHAVSSGGDSGGPLVINDRLAGILSGFVTHCPSRGERPDVSTNVAHPLYKNWIKAFLRHYDLTPNFTARN